MNIKTIQPTTIWLLAITLGGLILRLFFIQNFSLSNDELSAVNRLQFDNLSHMISYGIKPDGHPAGTQLLLYFWTNIFGLSPFSIRLPFLIISSLAPIFGYLFAKRTTHTIGALLFAAFIAFAQFPLIYGTLARPYGIGLTLILASAWLWNRLVFDENEKRKIVTAILLSICWSLTAYIHYFSALTSMIMGISGLFFIHRKNIVPYFTAIVLSLILYAPHISITLHQMQHKGVGSWLDKPDYQWIIGHLFYLFNSSFWVIGTFIAILIILSFELKKHSLVNLKKAIVYISWFFLPFLIGFIYSLQVDAVLQNSVLIFSTPFLIVAILSFFPATIEKKLWLFIVIWIGVLIVDLFYLHPLKLNNQFADFESAASDLKKWQDENARVVHFAQVNHPFYLIYYQPHLANLQKNTQYKSHEQIDYFANQLRVINTGFISFVNLKKEASPLIFDILNSRFGAPLEKKTHGALCESSIFDCNHKPVMPIKLNQFKTTEEFSGNIQKTKYNRLTDSLLIYAAFQIKSPPKNGHIVITTQDIAGTTLHWESAPFKYFINGNELTNIILSRRIKLDYSADKLKIYFWNPDKDSLQVERDSVNVIFY